MTVNPGFGGQAYIPTMEPKIAEVRSMIDDAGLGDRVDLVLDGARKRNERVRPDALPVRRGGR